jgi:hypothetical protein
VSRALCVGIIHHRDAEKKNVLTTEDTEITEFLWLFLLRALRVLCGENILLCASVSLWLICISPYRTAITSSLRSVMSSIE